MSFGGIKFRSKEQKALDDAERDLAEAKAKVAEMEKKIMHRVFIRNADLREMQEAKREHRKWTILTRKYQKKVDQLGGSK